MSVQRIFYCDADDCDCHVRTGKVVPPVFLTVREDQEPGNLHFCSWDCILKYAAKFEPEETIPLDPGDETP